MTLNFIITQPLCKHRPYCELQNLVKENKLIPSTLLFKNAQFKLFKVEKGIVFRDVCFNGTLLVLMNINISKNSKKKYELRINPDFKIFDIRKHGYM